MFFVEPLENLRLLSASPGSGYDGDPDDYNAPYIVEGDSGSGHGAPGEGSGGDGDQQEGTVQGRRLTPQEIAADPVVEAAIEEAWNNSNPHGPGEEKQENGFYVYYDHETGGFVIDHFPPGERDHIPGVPAPNNTETQTCVAFFYTHPNTEEEGYPHGPSPADEHFADFYGLPGILMSHDGLEFFGPELSPEVPPAPDDGDEQAPPEEAPGDPGPVLPPELVFGNDPVGFGDEEEEEDEDE